MNRKYIKLFFWFACFTGMATLVMSGDKAGEIRALKGKASIMRSGSTMTAALRDSIMLMDTVETDKDSKAKILFVDDSLLTMGERSRLLVKEYLLGDDKKRGQSVFNLLDGKVRAIVGKNKFEVHTPTAVAAARGTVLITWTKPNSSCVAVLQGIVDASNIEASVKGSAAVSAGKMTCIDKGKPPSEPEDIPSGLRDQLLEDTGIDDTPGMETPRGTPPDNGFNRGFSLPPIEQLPRQQGGYVY